MPTITSYASLSQGIQDFYDRSDLAGWVDYFIQIGENRLYRDILSQNKGRGVQWMETAFSGVTDPTLGTMAVPTGYQGIKYALAAVSGNTINLEAISAEQLYQDFPQRTPTASPQYIARDGQSFSFGPFPDSSYTISGIYWQRDAITSTTNPNSLAVTNIPDILLAACCAYAGTFLKDMDSAQMWEGIYSQLLTGMIMQDNAEDLSGSAPLIVAA